MSIYMIIGKHKKSYLNFLATFHHLNVPEDDWYIILHPTPLIHDLGIQELELVKRCGFASIYFSTSDPLLLDEQPFEEITVSDSDTDENPSPPTPHPCNHNSSPSPP